MHLRKLFSRRSAWRALNLSLVFALLLSSVAPALAAGESPATVVQTNAGCEQALAGASKVFMSVITAPAKAVMAAAEGIFSDPAAVERKLKYQVGKTYVYDYNLNVVSRSNQRNGEGTTSSDQSKTVMTAQAELSITSQEADGTFVGQVVMKTPYACSADLKNGTDTIADTTELAAELAKPLIFKQKPNGVITAVSYPANARATVVNMQKGVINALQNVLQDGASYKVAEVSGQGTFTPTYTLAEQNDTLKITKDYNDKSFSQMQKQGDDIKTLKLTSVVSTVLDGPKGVFSAVESREILETGDGTLESTDPNIKFDGITTWSTVTSQGKLTLKEVKAAVNVQAAASLEGYVDGGLEPIFEKPAANPLGIDLSKVNVDQELADFETTPTDPNKFAHILDLVAADTTEGVVDKIIARLNANLNNQEIANSYLDMLTVVATPKAQKALTSVIKPSVDAAGLSATFTITTQQQALINLVRIQSPISSTVDTVAQLSEDSAFVLQNTAITVLGATIDNLSDENPNQAQSLADGLVAKLNSAPLEQKEIYLEALGNAGVPSTLENIEDYTNVTASLSISDTKVVTEVIEAAAFNALRKIPGERAEGLLVAALTDTTQPGGTRLLVADVLRNRSDLSAGGSTALDGFQIPQDLAGGGTYYRTWGSWLGNSNLGINFPGSFTVSSINQLYLYADQQANAYVWGRRFEVARGQLLSYRYNPNPQYQFVGAYLDLAGNRIVKYEEYILCNYSRSGNLWANNWRWSQRVSIPIVWVITIDVEVKVTVNVAVDYAYGLNVCNVNNSSLYGGVTPRAWVGVVAEAYLNLRLARGGVGINATIMNTRLPGVLTLSYNGSTFRFCGDIRVSTQPLSGYIYAFADVGVDAWVVSVWKRVWQGNLATFNVGTYSYNVLVQCW